MLRLAAIGEEETVQTLGAGVAVEALHEGILPGAAWRDEQGLAVALVLAVTLGLALTGSVLKSDQEILEALQHNKEAGALLGTLGGWFSTEFTRNTPLLARLFIAHVTIPPLLIGQRSRVRRQMRESPTSVCIWCEWSV